MWTHENIKRVLIDFSLKVSNKPFHGVGSIYKKDNADWRNDIGLDSIELMELAAVINSFFNLLEMTDPPYLLSYQKLDEWVCCIFDAKQKANESINFATSGTSGKTKLIKHPISFLEQEINFLAMLFKEVTHIIPYVSCSNLYGFLMTLGLPEKLHVPVLYPSELDWKNIPPNALIVATPFHWQVLLDSLLPFIPRCRGVSSAAPMFSTLYKDIVEKNIFLTDIYGSTETGGIAYREHWLEPFTLFPYWKFTYDEKGNEIEGRGTHACFSLMDVIEKHSQETFAVLGRKDLKIKIAGKLTDLDHIKRVLEKIPNVKECCISAKAIEHEVLLQAQLYLFNDTEKERQEIKKRIRLQLQPHETPRAIYFSSSLPFE